MKKLHANLLPIALLLAVCIVGAFVFVGKELAAPSSADNIAWSQSAGNGTVFPACGSATNLIATCTGGTVTLSWGPPDPAAQGNATYYMGWMTDNNTGNVWGPANLGDTTSWTTSGLSGKSYSWWIEACDDSGCSAPVYGNNFSCDSSNPLPPPAMCPDGKTTAPNGDTSQCTCAQGNTSVCPAPPPGSGGLSVSVTELSPGANAAVHPGDTISYRLPFRSTGSQAQTNMRITDAIPANATFSWQGGGTANNSGGVSGGAVWWSDPALPPAGSLGDSGYVDFNVTVNASAPDGATICNSATYGTDQFATQTTNSVCNPVSNPSAPTQVWTTYCTGGNDTNGNDWQFWQYDNSTPPNYRYVGPGTGSCTPTAPPPAQVCTDPNATNDGGALPCQYSSRCQDTTATNYGQTGACQYPLCNDGTPPATQDDLSTCTCPQRNPANPSACNVYCLDGSLAPNGNTDQCPGGGPPGGPGGGCTGATCTPPPGGGCVMGTGATEPVQAGQPVQIGWGVSDCSPTFGCSVFGVSFHAGTPSIDNGVGSVSPTAQGITTIWPTQSGVYTMSVNYFVPLDPLQVDTGSCQVGINVISPVLCSDGTPAPGGDRTQCTNACKNLSKDTCFADGSGYTHYINNAQCTSAFIKCDVADGYSCVNSGGSVGCVAPANPTGAIAAQPPLVRSGSPALVAWNVSDASSCKVTSSGNTDTWSGSASGATGGNCSTTSQCSSGSVCVSDQCVVGKSTSPITSAMTYYLDCTGLDQSATPLHDSVNISVAPIFQEQ